jgi:DNA-binding transcriptional MerR regulator/methylmalonyl-CoA mutase cobalamin-binding subunit
MNNSTLSPSFLCTISDVERDTGVAKETLRVWERRYAFPRPERDPFGERVYSTDQVHKLRLVKRLIDLGFRPGKVIGCPVDELQALAEKTTASARPRPRGPAPDLQPYLDLCRTHQSDVLRRQLSQALLVMGLRNFVIELMAPLTAAVGDAWACGDLGIWEEHLFSETLQMVIRSAIFSVPTMNASSALHPRIVLTTMPQERHGLGLLMTEALLAAEGAACMSLGVQTPLPDIVEAAYGLNVDVVALSFSSSVNTRQVLDALKELRARLPDSVEIWAGGGNAALRRRAPAYVQVLSLHDIAGALADWRLRMRG